MSVGGNNKFTCESNETWTVCDLPMTKLLAEPAKIRISSGFFLTPWAGSAWCLCLKCEICDLRYVFQIVEGWSTNSIIDTNQNECTKGMFESLKDKNHQGQRP